jgi:hypothetical protein
VWSDSVLSAVIFGLIFSYKLDGNDCVIPFFFFSFLSILMYIPRFSRMLELLELFYFTSAPTPYVSNYPFQTV